MNDFLIGASGGKEDDSALKGEGENQTVGAQQEDQLGGQQGGGGDQDLEAKLNEMRQKYEDDFNKLRSSLDRRYSKDEERWKQENTQLREQLRQVLGTTMDDDARAEFEAEQMRLDYQRMTEELEQSKQNAEAYQNMMNYAQWFNQMGVPMEKLDFESPEALMESAWTGLRDTITDLRKQAAVSQQQTPPQEPPPGGGDKGKELQGEKPPEKPGGGDQGAFTGSGTAAPAGDVLEYVRKALSTRYGREVSLEETFQAIDNGAVDIDSLLRAGYKA